MAQKPILLRLPSDLVELVDAWVKTSRLPSRNAALVQLVERGLRGAPVYAEAAPAPTPDEGIRREARNGDPDAARFLQGAKTAEFNTASFSEGMQRMKDAGVKYVDPAEALRLGPAPPRPGSRLKKGK